VAQKAASPCPGSWALPRWRWEKLEMGETDDPPFYTMWDPPVMLVGL